MKYGELLTKLTVPEWTEQYIDYNKLKKTVKLLKATTNDIHTFRQHSVSLLQPIDVEVVEPRSEHEINIDSVTDPQILDELMPIPIEMKTEICQPRSVIFNRESSVHFPPDMTFQTWNLEPFLNSIHRAIDQMSDHSASDEVKEEIFDLESTFIRDLEVEINKVSKFYSQQKLYFAQKCEHLFEELRSYRTRNAMDMVAEEEEESKDEVKSSRHSASSNSSRPSLDIPISEKKRLKKRFRITYHGVVNKFSSYRIVNMTAVSKICKKHDKNSVYDSLQKDVVKMLEAQPDNFGSNKFVQYLVDRLESAYARYLSDHNKKIYGVQTLRKLDVSSPDHVATHKATQRWCGIGFLSGGSVAMLANCCILLLIDPVEVTADRSRTCSFWDCAVTERAAAMMSGSVCICFYLWLWAFNLYIFESQRFNHCYIFEADPTSLLHSQNVAAFAAVMSIVVSFAVTAYVTAFYFWSAFPLRFVALTLFAFWILLTVFPGNNRYRKTRNFVRQSAWRILRSPFSSVYFIDFFIADQLTSLFIIIVGFGQSLCGFIHRADSDCDSDSMVLFMNILKILPFWWRFAQCVRRWHDDREQLHHLVNGGKYLSSIITVLIVSLEQHYVGSIPLSVLRLSFGAVSTLYAFWWDLRMDWGLGDGDKQSGHRFLRKELRFPPLAYYMAISSNFVFRISWAFALFPSAANLHYFNLPLAAVEILRRCIWNVFRLENEHLNNCGKFREVRDVPALPNTLSFGDLEDEHDS